MTIKVYTKDHCPYCTHAKGLLSSLGYSYEEIALGTDRKAIMELVSETGMKTLPQIFIHDKLIGGYDDLKSLADSGRLETILAK